MVRSMYSGVSGLRSHQTRMDTIGNNIANVNTYGFKSGRTTFRDIYYQQMRGATQPTAAQGGVNPTAVGYGSKVGSVDLMMDGSTFSMTDQTMDIAIDGEGFFQVQDANGNTFYTRAGMLSFDSVGNLVDMQGNYVLGVNGDPTGRGPASERIQVVLGPVEAAAGTITQTINGKEFTISATNNTKDSNINMSFTTDSGLADGDVVASISSTGIVIKMHPENTYSSLDDLNSAVNAAITRANNGQPHVAGDINVKYTGDPAKDPFSTANLGTPPYLTAAEICSTNYNIVKGSIAFTNTICGGIQPSGTVGNTFGEHFTATPGVLTNIASSYSAANGGKWNFVADVGGVRYEGSVDAAKNSSGKFKMVNPADENDYFEMSRPSFDRITDAWIAENGGAGTPATYELDATTANWASMVAGDKITIAGATYELQATDVGAANLNTLLANLANAVNNGSTTHKASVSGSNFILTSRTNAHDLTGQNWTSTNGTYPGGPIGQTDPGSNPANLTDGSSFVLTPAMVGNPTAKPSTAPRTLGFSSTSFAMRGGTAGGAQTLADMTGIQIGSNGVIIGYDSVGKEIMIGRIDLATFANPGGLNQAGSSNYTVSKNSGQPVLGVPGTGGSGQLVGGTLELSNVDLSREFSDMITTQRGYQANSRIITVSDTMLEELINLKR